jgi:diguanylate cyclase (GGDEF)-like protein
MTKHPINVLLIEDNPADARLIDIMLAEAKGIVFDLTWIDNLTASLAYLKTHEPDVILLDFGLPESSGLDTLHRLFLHVTKIPTLVVMSGLTDESIALEAVHSGAQDYLVKGQVNSALLVRSIRYAIERRQSEEALRQAHAELERRVKERTAELANTVDALYAEIAERQQAEERIRYMAHYDVLTGLPNRVLLQDRIQQAVIQAQRNETRMAVLFIDLDFFKHVNDSLGHHVGDRLLQLVAVRLQRCLREGDSVGRLGGDEFVLSLSSISSSNGAAVAAQKVLEVLDDTFVVNGHELPMSGSIGISVYPDNGTDVETLMRAADTAMYHAKEKGRRNFRFFTPALDKAAQQRLTLECRLRQALTREEFALQYQPQVNMETGEIFSVEALLRWPQPGAEPMPCAEFISLAEETGLILPIGKWVLCQACKQLKQWHNAGFAGMRMAVNLSARQFSQPHFVDMVLEIISEAGLPPTALDLEITETLLLQGTDEIVTTLNQLSSKGIRLSLDDFGTGYASLAYLLRFPMHAIKIDQSFVRNIGLDPNATALITAIIVLANSLNMTILAEGVETPQQVSFLLEQGCTTGQGFYYSEAVPGDVLIDMLGTGGRIGRIANARKFDTGRTIAS